jgi:uncharacterized protein involved in exopolysaccharide biosynthesis
MTIQHIGAADPMQGIGVATGTDVAAPPARMMRSLWRRLIRGGRVDSRMRRYVVTGTLGCAAAWGISLAYLQLSPPTYTSAFTFVLPGSGAGSSLNLERLGQATTTSSSPFASADLSPTENYRKMLLSKRLLTAAAEKLGEPAERFPLPKVELSDQTKLISVKVGGRTGEQAAARADAVRNAFLQMLDSLRSDEIQTRDAAYRNMLAAYKARLNETRQRLIEHEAATGLASTDQYGTIVASVERLRDQLRDVDAKLAHMRAGVAELTRLLDTSVEMANFAMLLRADPQFQALLDQLAKEDAELATLTGIRGQNNPRVVDLQAERSSTAARITTRIADLTGVRRQDVLKMRDLSIRDERARLFERLIGQIADTEAMAAMRTQLKSQLQVEQARVLSLSEPASRLDDLKRDVQVADAVFSSALARIDTSKSDFFASYPIVQTLEAPETPLRPSSPLPLFAIAGGFAASLFILAALVLTWLRTALLQRILKNA